MAKIVVPSEYGSRGIPPMLKGGGKGGKGGGFVSPSEYGDKGNFKSGPRGETGKKFVIPSEMPDKLPGR